MGPSISKADRTRRRRSGDSWELSSGWTWQPRRRWARRSWPDSGEAGPGLWNGAGLWTLGRLGARVPQYGPLNTTLPIELVEAWLPAVIELDPGDRRVAFAAVQLTRRTGDRYRDVGAEARRSVFDWLRSGAAPASYLRLVKEGGDLDRDSQAAAYGESLPAGIRLL